MSTASDFESELKKCLILFQVLGLQQFSISGISKDTKNSGKSWKIFAQLVLVVLLEVSFVVLACIAAPWKIFGAARTGVHVVLYQARRFSYFAEGFFFLVLAFVNANGQFKVLQSFHQIMKEFKEKLEVTIDYSKFRKAFMWRILFVGSFTVTTQVVALFYYLNNSEKNFWNILGAGFRFLELFNASIHVYPGLVFVFYVDIFNLHLRTLRKSLENTLQKLDAERNLILVKSAGELQQLSTIKSIHLLLCETHKQINDSVGTTVAFFLLHAILILILHGYSCFLALISHDFDNFDFWIRINAAVFHVIFLVVIVHASEGHRSEVRIFYLNFCMIESVWITQHRFQK